ncbi:porin [Rhizobium sp. G21]|uniref:porin n=1 Tax=Rhizobium sp. G21 TaxID=2758439 RepID=UPI001602D7C7|nr:porin [Rhizobium sp. G21]MBB1249662.1 porin [Rhizobium sp. G21]
MKRFAAAAILVFLVTEAFAEDAVTAPPSDTPALDANPCAVYGEGYAPVNGGKTCIRIGGRIRYDMSVGGDRKSGGE